MERLLLYHFLYLLLTGVVSLVGGARKSKPAANKQQRWRSIENVENGQLPARSYSSEGELNLSDDLDLSDSRINSWDEDYTAANSDVHEGSEEEESAEDYTEDYSDEAMSKADRLLLKGEVEEKCLKDEKEEGDEGVMKRLTRLSSDVYLTHFHRSLDCENPENAGTEAKLKLKEMLERLPFRPLFTLQPKSITNKNYQETMEKVVHTEQRRMAISREKRRNKRADIEKTFKGKHVKLAERATAYVIYARDDVRGRGEEDEQDTVDCQEEEEAAEKK